ncbi:IS701 family transposase [Rhodococcus sp. H29-C3]|uniref:IS701 family transposase n=1 Tax=Rhodococcus sp. H29-C3 TaxID=3046307 RepID=UPI0024B9B5E8|nr:IS701 family transposase [Rhodococcus sp. H29-C3]MDJ0362459.1 IS701 family transposase [Rhodococcus sp. H29-C3]
MLGLLSGLDRKNCWTIAESRGDSTPDGLQHMRSRSKCDGDLVRDDLRDYVVEAFGDPAGVLIVDETGDLKKGTSTVGVQRQYTGTAGRIENAQVAVYLTYAGRRGHALIDRALYLPASWTQDPNRCDAAGVPADKRVFATKPALAQSMITVALDAGTQASWVTGDEVYGADPGLRAELETRRVGYVMAIACSHRVPTGTGSVRIDTLVDRIEEDSWQIRSAGAGCKGPRWYSWAWIPLPDNDCGFSSMLLRRNDTTGEMAYYRCFSPTPVTLTELVRVAGWRWRIEESFQAAKGQAGLDKHQVRRWTSWHRWVTLAMAATAFLAVTTAAERERTPAHDDLIALTVNELRRLFDAIVLGALAGIDHILSWSTWRRKYQATAQRCHYRRRSDDPQAELLL